MSLTILHNGSPITDVTPGSPPIYVPGFSMVPAERQNAVHGMPGRMLQVRAGGVDIGNGNPAVLDLLLDPASILVTRGTGEQSNVITVRKLTVPPVVDAVWALYPFDGDALDYSGNARHAALNGIPGFNVGSFGAPGGFTGQTQSLRTGGPSIGNVNGAAAASFTAAVFSDDSTSGGGAFTVEFQFFQASFTGSNTFFLAGGALGAGLIAFSMVSVGIQVTYRTSTADFGAVSLNNGVQHFVSMSRSAGSSTVSVAVDGVLLGTFSSSLGTGTLDALQFNCGSITYSSVNSYVANVRLTRDVNRYTSFPYAVPTEPFAIP